MDHDFLIIGGGIAGVSLAAHLAAQGRTLLLEAEPALAHHASGRSAALYEPHYGNPTVVALSLASGDALRALPGVLSPRGLMLVAQAHEAAAFHAEAAAMDMTPVSLDQALTQVPILNPAKLAHAATASHAWDIDTDLLIQGYARNARNQGADILTHSCVTAITRMPQGWHVTTPTATWTARILINAAGAWVDRIATLAGVRPLGFQPMRRSMARIPAPGGHDVTHWPMIFGAGETWYAKPDAGALIVSPAEEHPMDPHDAWADDMVLATGLARYEEMVIEPVTRLLSNWAGLRTFAPDRVPVIGRDPACPDFFWLAGQGGYGFQTAPAAARLATSLLADLPHNRPDGLPDDLIPRLSPNRF